MLLEHSVLLFVFQHQLVPCKGKERTGESLTAVGGECNGRAKGSLEEGTLSNPPFSEAQAAKTV